MEATLTMRADADARVAHEHVEPVGCLPHLSGEPAHLGEVSQVGRGGARAVRPTGATDLIGGTVEPSPVPAVQDQGGPVGGQPAGQGPAEAVGGAGDEDRRPVGHAGSRPGHVKKRRRRRG